jgi:large subunit ribosomal protein L6
MYSESLRQVTAKSEVVIPGGVQVEVSGPVVKVTGPLGTMSKDFSKTRVKITKDEAKLEVSTDLKGRRGKAMVGAIVKRLSNMMRGVKVHYVVNMRLVFSHFPPTIEAQGGVFSVKNFMGERTPRRVAIPHDVQVEVKGQEITVTSVDIESATQFAGSVETTTKTIGKDQRIYLDGIYVQSKRYEDEAKR